MAGVSHNLNRLEQILKQYRLEDIQLQLSGFRRLGDRHVVADDVEAGLVADLGDDRIDLTRHDRAARLPVRQLDFR